jgi:hypothetical protein
LFGIGGIRLKEGLNGTFEMIHVLVFIVDAVKTDELIKSVTTAGPIVRYENDVGALRVDTDVSRVVLTNESTLVVEAYTREFVFIVI